MNFSVMTASRSGDRRRSATSALMTLRTNGFFSTLMASSATARRSPARLPVSGGQDGFRRVAPDQVDQHLLFGVPPSVQGAFPTPARSATLSMVRPSYPQPPSSPKNAAMIASVFSGRRTAAPAGGGLARIRPV